MEAIYKDLEGIAASEPKTAAAVETVKKALAELQKYPYMTATG